MADNNNNNNNSGGFRGWMSGWNTERVSGWFSAFKSPFSQKENDASKAVEKITIGQVMHAKWAEFRTRFPKKKENVGITNQDGTITYPSSDSTLSKLTTTIREKYAAYKNSWSKKEPKKTE